MSCSPAATDNQNNDFDANVDEVDGSEHGLLEHPQVSWQCYYVSDASDSAAYGEAFTDANGNGIWDTGESFTDENGNGVRDPGVMSDDVHDELDEQIEWFLRYANFLTLRSNAFTIISRGQVTDSLGNILAERKIRAIIERGRTPRGVKILDFRFLTDY